VRKTIKKLTQKEQQRVVVVVTIQSQIDEKL
jgi:hypothetical protein